MTDHGGAASPRTRIEAWAACVRHLIASAVMDETGISGGHTTPPERRAIREAALAVVDGWLARDLAAIEAAQEAPAPEGLRAALRAMCDAWASGGWRLAKDYSALEAVYEAALRVLNDLDDLAATPPTPADPPRPFDEADGMCPNCVTPWKCNGPHLSEQTAARAEARPPEGLDTDTANAILRNSGIPLAKWLPNGKAAHLTAEDYAYLAARLSAGGATKP